MSEEIISPLRQRMIEDMTIRNFAPKTQHGYIRAVKNFSDFLGHSPTRATFEDIRRYQLSLASSGLGVPSINATMTALRLFLQGHLAQGQRHGGHRLCPRTAAVAGRAESQGGGAAAGGGSRDQVQGGLEHRLWGRPAGLRGHLAQGRRHRQRPDGHHRCILLLPRRIESALQATGNTDFFNTIRQKRKSLGSDSEPPYLGWYVFESAREGGKD